MDHLNNGFCRSNIIKIKTRSFEIHFKCFRQDKKIMNITNTSRCCSLQFTYYKNRIFSTHQDLRHGYLLDFATDLQE